MKRRLFFCMALMLCCATTVFAQNDKISYQAVVRGTDNHLVVNTDLTVTVSLANSENGPVVYKETHAVTSNMNGLISLLIGDGTPVDGSWADIQWSNAWVTAVINKGGTPVATHKMPLNAVPYALQAGYADSVNTNVIANYLATHSVPGVSNVQSDWNQTDNTADDYIKNKPSIRDSVSNYLTNNHYVTETVMSGAIHDSITNNISSQIHDSLSGYDIKDCADVNACVANSLADGTSALNQIVDSIAGNTIHDSIVNHISTQIRDSVSNYLTNNHYVTETVMSGAIHDSITNNISSQIHDSITNLAGRIPAVNDATFTVAITDGTTTTFTANSATDATVTLAKVAGTGSYNDLTDTPTNLVTTDGDNTYTGSNDFTGGTVTVPSAGINLKTDDATSCSNQNAVNACDLLAVFDSLNRRIQGVFDSLKHLNDSLAEELAALKPTLTLTSDLDGGSVNLCGNSSVEVVYTATLNNANAADYTFAWTVGGEAQSETGSTLTYTYTAAATDVKVVCVATRAGSAALKDSLTTTVTSGGTPVALGLCDNYLTVTVVSVSGSPNSISWGDGSTGTSVSADMTHTYSTSGTYTLTASNASGCKATYTMALAAHTTCTLSEMGNTTLNANEHGSATAIDSVKDHEGNWYEVVQIGNQCWLKENLRTRTSPKTGNNLVNPLGNTGNASTQSYTSKVAHWYLNDSTTYAPKGYGLLYNWCAAVDTFRTGYAEVATESSTANFWSCTLPSGHRRGICPAGWHLPTDDEWNTMEATVNGSDVSTSTGYRGSHAGKLSTGCDWTTSTTVNAPGNYSNAERNSSGFAAVPAGVFGSSFGSAGLYAHF